MTNKPCGRLSSTIVDPPEFRVSPVCSVRILPYLRVEPKALWVDPSLWVDNSVFSNTKWNIK